MRRIFTFILMSALGMCSIQAFSQNSINTTRPAPTWDTNAVCVGSSIGIPCTSNGQYSSGNYYEAQLSDTTGLFFNPVLLTSVLNYQTLYSTTTFSVVIPDVPDGCNYYVRIRSTLPLSNLVSYGPFCIQHCDLKTNHGQDIQICLTPTTSAIDTPVSVHVNTYNSNQVYNAGNQFKIQILDTNNFNNIGIIGALGSVTATGDTSVMMHIPPLATLQTMGINPGHYYLRVIATNAQYQDSSLGSLIRLTIGAPADNPYTIFNQVYYYPTSNGYDTINGPICPAPNINSYTFVLLEPRPWNFNTEYEWFGNFQGDSTAGIDISFNINNANFLFIVRVQEISFGCRGPLSPPDTIVVIGPPSVTLSTPSIVCVHDTTQWTVPYVETTHYHWISLLHGTMIDSLSNMVKMRYDSVGTYHLNVSATNICGSANSSNIINVIAPPTMFLRDSVVNMTVYFYDTVTTILGNSYLWHFGDGGVSTLRNAVHTYSSLGNYTATLTVTNTCGSDSGQISIHSLGISELSGGNEISLYPNPNNGIFTLNYNLKSYQNNSQLIINDIAGRTVYSQNIIGNAGNEIIKLPLNDGIYFWKISTETGNQSSIISGGKLVVIGN